MPFSLQYEKAYFFQKALVGAYGDHRPRRCFYALLLCHYLVVVRLVGKFSFQCAPSLSVMKGSLYNLPVLVAEEKNVQHISVGHTFFQRKLSPFLSQRADNQTLETGNFCRIVNPLYGFVKSSQSQNSFTFSSYTQTSLPKSARIKGPILIQCTSKQNIVSEKLECSEL